MDSTLLRQLIAPFFDMRVTDVVDIVVATGLAYALIAWIRRTQSAQVAGGILILGLVYVAARALDLQLTAWMFQGFFAIFLVVIVVIFQEELRQLFERVATWRWRAAGPPSRTTAAVDVLVLTLTELARDRIGAIVVLPGRMPLSRHVQGGIELNGAISLPLLKSIFDPHSPGHDGAVIVEDGRVTRFAAHLPLSKDFTQLARVGTRHSAALGLAELSDAFCVVVSEERGTISVAHDGRLRPLSNPQELGQLAQRFLAEIRPTSEGHGGLRRLLTGNFTEKAVSLVVVLGLWLLFVPGSRPRTESYEVPVEVINLPAHYVLEQVSPEAVEVVFSGPSRSFILLDPGALEVTIDASLARLGRRSYRVTEDNLTRPQTLAVEAVKPATVKIAVRKGDGAS